MAKKKSSTTQPKAKKKPEVAAADEQSVNQQQVVEGQSVRTQTELEVALINESARLMAEVDRLTEENKKLQRTCDRLQSSADKSDTYLNQLVAMKNDFESYKRRMKFNGEQAKLEGAQAVLISLLDVCDNFELAKKHLKGNNLKAFNMVHQQFLDILQDNGVEEMDVLNQPFDCMKMNALSQLDYGEDKHNLVVEVYKKGYVMGDKVLRYAEVIVGA